MFQFEEAVQYVINGYPNSPIEDLKGDVSLLTVLSTPLAVTVVTSHCSEVFSLKQHVPGLMLKAISPEKVIMIVIIPLLHSLLINTTYYMSCVQGHHGKCEKNMCERVICMVAAALFQIV